MRSGAPGRAETSEVLGSDREELARAPQASLWEPMGAMWRLAEKGVLTVPNVEFGTCPSLHVAPSPRKVIQSSPPEAPPLMRE